MYGNAEIHDGNILYIIFEPAYIDRMKQGVVSMSPKRPKSRATSLRDFGLTSSPAS